MYIERVHPASASTIQSCDSPKLGTSAHSEKTVFAPLPADACEQVGGQAAEAVLWHQLCIRQSNTH